jgi:hypothetical protein
MMQRKKAVTLLIFAICALFIKAQDVGEIEIQGEKPLDINLDDIDITQAYYPDKAREDENKPNTGSSSQNRNNNQYNGNDARYHGNIDHELRDLEGYHPGMGHPGMGNMGAHPDIGNIGGHPGMGNVGGHPGMGNIGNMQHGGHPGMQGGRQMYGDMEHGGMDMHMGGGHNGGRRRGKDSMNQQHQVYNNNNNNNNESKSLFGKYGSFFSSSFYEILMLVFMLGFVYNCIFGRTVNDKFATAWFNANKKYFEDSYNHLGITKEKEEENMREFGTPMM